MVLLAKNPYYLKWQVAIPSGTSEADKNLLIFAQAATRADVIKKDPAYHADGKEGGHNPDGPGEAENLGYSDTRMHKYWHYDDTPFSQTIPRCHHTQHQMHKRKSKRSENPRIR